MKQGSYLKHLAPTVGHKEDILSEMGKHNMNISCELVEEMMKADMNTFAKDIPCLASSERKGIDDRIKDVWGSQGDNPVYIRDIPHVQSASQPIEGAKTPTDRRFPIPVSEIRDRKRPLGQMIWKRPVQKPTAISKEKAEHKRRIHRFNIQYPSTSTLSDPEIKEHAWANVVQVNQTSQGTTLQYFPVLNRKTMQLAYMLLPSYIGSPADAIRTMPGFTPFLADHRHEGLEPKCLLTGVSLEICGNYW